MAKKPMPFKVKSKPTKATAPTKGTKATKGY